MMRPRIVLGVALALLVLLGGVGYWVYRQAQVASSSPSFSAPSPPSVSIEVNDDPILREELDRAFLGVIRSYIRFYSQTQSVADVLARLTGPSGSYSQLQLRYLAAEKLIERHLLRQEARRRSIAVPQEELEQAWRARYERFLQESRLTEEDLRELFQDPREKFITQQLLNISEESVEALQARIREETHDTLLAQRLAEVLFDDEGALATEEGQERFRRWLEERKAQSRILYHEPLLRAYHLEQQIARAQTPQERRKAIEEAIAAYERVQQEGLVQGTEVNYSLARLYAMKVQLDLEEKRLAAERDGGEAKELSELDKRILRNRDMATALFLSLGMETEAQLQALMAEDPENPLYYLLYAYVMMNQGQPGIFEAIKALQYAVQLDPNYTDAYALLGQLNLEIKRYEEAVEAYEKALSLAKAQDDNGQLDPDDGQVMIQRKLAESQTRLAEELSDAPGQRGDPEARREALIAQAEELLRELLNVLDERDPEYARVLAGLGDVERLRGNYPAAIGWYENVLQYENNLDVRVQLGRTRLLAGQFPEAEETFLAVLEEDPQWAPAHLGLAELYRAQGQKEKAFQAYRQAFDTGEPFFDYRELREIARTALEIRPNDVPMRLALGDFYREHYVYTGAVEQYEAVLAIAPDSVAAYQGLGLVALDRLRYEEALAHFEKALALDPPLEEQIALYEYIVEAALRAEAAARASAQAQTEVDLDPEGRAPNALLQLGKLYLEAGRPWAAQRALAKLRQRYPDYRTVEVVQLTEKTAQALTAELPGEPVEDQGYWVIAPGESHPPYNSLPPTSGWQYALPAPWGVHTSQIPDEVQVRNLAGGGVLLQYRPGLDETTVRALEDLVRELRRSERYCRLIVAPYEGLEAPIVLTAWTRIDRLEQFDRDRILRFIDALLGRGPAVGEVECRQP